MKDLENEIKKLGETILKKEMLLNELKKLLDFDYNQ